MVWRAIHDPLKCHSERLDFALVERARVLPDATSILDYWGRHLRGRLAQREAVANPIGERLGAFLTPLSCRVGWHRRVRRLRPEVHRRGALLQRLVRREVDPEEAHVFYVLRLEEVPDLPQIGRIRDDRLVHVLPPHWSQRACGDAPARAA